MIKNRFTLIGRVVREHELKTLPNGSYVLNFTLAQNKKWKDSEGNPVEKALYFEVTAFWRIAQVLAEYSTKGSKLLVEGDIENNNHEKEIDWVIHKTYGFRFTIKEFEFLDNKKKDDWDNKTDWDVF